MASTTESESVVPEKQATPALEILYCGGELSFLAPLCSAISINLPTKTNVMKDSD